ncbi:protein kinase [Angomonas deanei]|uniref:Protein tyrosine kinase/Protein kinase domain/Fungal protein kinase, putative n=1 Tax=Angomonas deanei TaxID=59799 RepID=A0A7G2CG05_9TRYP|nr:protein kinase [Angomonas deanei]CAD2217102.1 Protein tyrosine kinase/Protein kinase domain/Fungal protein kinase, putative [Angomonas deanei]|eukprot:EPY24093.1 protein kinase [Angomonas deanei]
MLPYSVLQSTTHGGEVEGEEVEQGELPQLSSQSSVLGSTRSDSRPSSRSGVRRTTSGRDTGERRSDVISPPTESREEHISVSMATPDKRGDMEASTTIKDLTKEKSDEEDVPPSAMRRIVSRFKLKQPDSASTSARQASASARFVQSVAASKAHEASNPGLKRRYGTLLVVCFSDFFNIANMVNPEFAKEISKAFISFVCKYAKRNHGYVSNVQPDRLTLSWNSFKPCKTHQTVGLNTAINLVEDVQQQLYNRFPELRPLQVPMVHATGMSCYLLAGAVSSGKQKHLVLHSPYLFFIDEVLKLQLGLTSRLIWIEKPECSLPAQTAAVPVDIVTVVDTREPHFANINAYVDPNVPVKKSKLQYTLYEICSPVPAVIAVDFADAFEDFRDGQYEQALKKFIRLTEMAELERLREQEKRERLSTSENSHSQGNHLEESLLKMEAENNEPVHQIIEKVYLQAYRFRELCLLYTEVANDKLLIDDAKRESLQNFTLPSKHKRLLPHWYLFKSMVDPDGLVEDSSSANCTITAEDTENPIASPRVKYQYAAHRKSTVDDIIRDIHTVSSKGSSVLVPDSNSSGNIVGRKNSAQTMSPVLRDSSTYNQFETSDIGALSTNQPYTPLMHNEFKDGTMIYRLSEKKLGETPTSEVRLALSYTGSLVAVKTIVLSHGDAGNAEENPAGLGGRRANGVQRRRNQRRGILSATVDVEALTNEIDLLSKLLDPHIVRYISAVVQPNRLLLVMEYVSGGSLFKLMEQYSSTMTVSQARIYLRDVLKGLSYLHKKGIVHRDIKPQNVLIPQTGNCKLSDFGISKEISKDSKGQKFDGTPFYMAPEAASGEACAASDIWSFGIMLAEVITMKLPWPHSMNPHAMRYQLVKNEELTPVVQSPELMPADAMFVFECCTRRNPIQRPTAEAILKMPFFRSK